MNSPKKSRKVNTHFVWLVIGILFVLGILASVIVFTKFFHPTAQLPSHISASTSPSPTPVLTILMSPDGVFRITFPAEPTITAKDLQISSGNLHTVNYQYDDNANHRTFIVQTQTYADGYLRGPMIREMLDGFGTLIGKNTERKTTLLTSSYMTLNGAPAKDEEWQIGTGYLRMKNVIVGNTIYSLSVISGHNPDEPSEQFMQSFGEGSSASPNTFTSQEGDFQVVFPDPPKRNDNELPIQDSNQDITIHAIQYVSNNPQKWGGMVEVFTFPTGYLRGQKIQEALDQTTQSIHLAIRGSTLVSSQFSTYGNYPAMDGLIQVDSKRYIRVKNIVVGDKMYAISTLSPDKSDTTFSQFMNSFELLNK